MQITEKDGQRFEECFTSQGSNEEEAREKLLHKMELRMAALEKQGHELVSRKFFDAEQQARTGNKPKRKKAKKAKKRNIFCSRKFR